MNDFTKEELQIIQWEINTAINKLSMADIPRDKHLYLIGKIQVMIDNYCEHSDRQYYEHVPVYECKECQMVSML